MLPTQKRSSHCHTKKMVKKSVREEKLRKEVIWSKNAKNRLGGEKQRTRLGSIRYNNVQVKKGKEDSLCSNPVRQLAKGIVTTYKTKVTLFGALPNKFIHYTKISFRYDNKQNLLCGPIRGTQRNSNSSRHGN